MWVGMFLLIIETTQLESFVILAFLFGEGAKC